MQNNCKYFYAPAEAGTRAHRGARSAARTRAEAKGNAGRTRPTADRGTSTKPRPDHRPREDELPAETTEQRSRKPDAPGEPTQETTRRTQGPRAPGKRTDKQEPTRGTNTTTPPCFTIYYTTGKPDVKRKQAKKYIFLLRTPNTETTQNDTQCSRETSPTTPPPHPSQPPPLFPSLKAQYSVGPQCEQHPEWTDLSSRVSNSKGRFILQKLNSPFPLSFCKINTLLLPYSCLTNPGMEGIIPPWAGGIRQVSTGLSY